jgi:small subunit ribosomal protein S16
LVRIRLKKIGMRHRPSYRVVAIEKSRSRDGRYLESLGHYDPRTKLLKLDLERVKHWISKGAQPSDTVDKLIRRYEKAREPSASVTDMAARAAEAAVLIPDLPEIAAEKADDIEAPAEMAVAADTADEPEPEQAPAADSDHATKDEHPESDTGG